MLTDDEIKTLLNSAQHQHPGRYFEVLADDIGELCTRLLSAEARLKALEEALRPFADAIWVWSDDYALQADGIEREQLSRARIALQEQSK
jgi:hypothetical protein